MCKRRQISLVDDIGTTMSSSDSRLDCAFYVEIPEAESSLTAERAASTVVNKILIGGGVVDSVVGLYHVLAEVLRAGLPADECVSVSILTSWNGFEFFGMYLMVSDSGGVFPVVVRLSDHIPACVDDSAGPALFD